MRLAIPLVAALAAGEARAGYGDGTVDPFEQCDDNNRTDGDGCSSIGQVEGDLFPVVVYRKANPPPTPALSDLPLLSQVSRHGITWTFAQPARVGRYVNGDYYVVGPVTVTAISPAPANGRHGSMLNIKPNIQKSGWDDRIISGRYDASLRVSLPISLTPGNKLLSSRSAASNPTCVLRPSDSSESPVASISILTSVAAPQPLDALRPSYAEGSDAVYLTRNLRRDLLPRLAPPANAPPLSEFEGYLKRPWIDSVFFHFDVPAEYMASYGREHGYLMGFAGLLLTLDHAEAAKEPLLVYMVQYGVDLFGLVQRGHKGWPAFGGHGSGRKLPILLAGAMLEQDAMKNVQASFGEDEHTLWVTETPPAGTFTKTWHKVPQTVVYSGHHGIDGESYNAGWGPYEHLPPAQWKLYTGYQNPIGETYRRCCTSVAWIGEALAARLIPGVMEAWKHEPFFAYADRWMTPEDPADLATLQSVWNWSVALDFQQGQSWKILSGGGYKSPWKTFADDMWKLYRNAVITGADAGTPAPDAQAGAADSGTPLQGSDAALAGLDAAPMSGVDAGAVTPADSGPAEGALAEINSGCGCGAGGAGIAPILALAALGLARRRSRFHNS